MISRGVLVKETLVRKKTLLGFLLVRQRKAKGEVNMSNCEPLAKEIEKCANRFHSSNFMTDGQRTVTYS